MSTWVLAVDGEHVAIVYEGMGGVWYVEDNAAQSIGNAPTREGAMDIAEAEFTEELQA